MIVFITQVYSGVHAH